MEKQNIKLVENRLWHRPSVKKLIINIDTQGIQGSGTDLFGEEIPIGA